MRRQMNSRVFLINLIVVLLLLVGGGFVVYYYFQTATYISTNNASVSGQMITIAAPSSGKLTEWNGDIGKTYHTGERVGTIQAGTVRTDVTFPIGATIVQQNAVPGSIAAAGIPLARAYDLNNLWVTANVDETSYNDLKTDQVVDVYVDAFPGTTLTGKVSKIGLATAGTFSLLPASNTSANYTKVTQVIPVTISLDGYRGLTLVPGMSASVRIHR